MLHAAMHDAVTAAGPGAVAVAAAAQAAHGTLSTLYPHATAALDRQLGTSLATVRDPSARATGTRLGARSAIRIVAARVRDGSAATAPVLAPGSLAGQFRPAPPRFADTAFTHWGGVTPFALDRADQFCPAPYPSLTSARHHEAVREVTYLGRDTSGARTADQTDQAHFWAAPIHTYWFEVARSAVAAHRVDLSTAARVFNDLSVAIADATIAVYEANYHHHLLWRPVTAIRHDAATDEDVDWRPLLDTPATPSYPAGHSAVAQAAATVLTHHFGAADPVSLTAQTSARPGRSPASRRRPTRPV